MKKKGVELISIFLISMLVFCSFSVSAYADTNEWGYNDSYVNSVSSENNKLFFLPPAPDSSFTDYIIVYYNNNYYLVLGNGNFLIFGSGFIQEPSSVVCYIYQKTSNNWEPSSFPDSYHGMFPGFYPGGYQIIDSTSNLHYWGAGTPVQEKPITNYTGYRLYWNLSLIFQKILEWTDNIANLILSVVLLRYLCLAFLAGEVILFVVLLLRRLGDLRCEKEDF